LRVIERIVEAPYKFLKRYFKRDLSEADSADKRRFGWLIRQKREDRREMFFVLDSVTTCLQSVKNYVPKSQSHLNRKPKPALEIEVIMMRKSFL